jgi:hypothetical protein
LLGVLPLPADAGDIVALRAKDTLAAVELDRGDQLQYTLQSGRTATLTLEDTDAQVLERVTPGGIVYQFACRVRIDGQPLTLRRYVCSQECFYEPYVVGGLRIWPDTVKAVFDLIPIRYPREGNLQCIPRKAARLAVQDASLRICPQPTHPWLEEDRDFIDVGRCYNGDDCYLGPYLGEACHIGMDINHPKGSLLLAPIDFDTQAYFNSLERGDNNNRWRGIRRWPNGDVWALQTHHLIGLLVPQGTPLVAGTKYATTAGVHVGSHAHTHFEFKIGRKNVGPTGERTNPPRANNPASIACPIDFDDESEAARKDPEVLHLDPWIVFWQIFEDRKARRGELRAAFRSPATAETGEPAAFAAEDVRLGRQEKEPSCFWTFGDGGFAVGREPRHVFARPGIHPVTLVIDDGQNRAAGTRHVVVSGKPMAVAVLALTAPEEPLFRVRPAEVADVYGSPIQQAPHTLQFVARASRPAPDSRMVVLRNLGAGSLAKAATPVVEYADGAGWLEVRPVAHAGEQALEVAVDASRLAPGCYWATVAVDCPGAVNSPQCFRVAMEVRGESPSAGTTVDDRDRGFYATPYFWVGHRFCRCPANRRGHGGFYLTNGGRPAAGEFARFTPDLKAGGYRIALDEATPFRPDTEFHVRVRHAGGETIVRVCPDKSREIGTFEFREGTDGFVEILAGGSKGLVVVDAVVFQAK